MTTSTRQGTIFCRCQTKHKNLVDDQESNAKISLQDGFSQLRSFIRMELIRGPPYGSSSDQVLFGKAKEHHTMAIFKESPTNPQTHISCVNVLWTDTTTITSKEQAWAQKKRPRQTHHTGATSSRAPIRKTIQSISSLERPELIYGAATRPKVRTNKTGHAEGDSVPTSTKRSAVQGAGGKHHDSLLPHQTHGYGNAGSGVHEPRVVVFSSVFQRRQHTSSLDRMFKYIPFFPHPHIPTCQALVHLFFDSCLLAAIFSVKMV